MNPTYFAQIRWVLQTITVIFLTSFVIFQPMEEGILTFHQDHFVSQDSHKEEGETQENENRSSENEEDEDEVEKLISFQGLPQAKKAYLSAFTQKIANHFSDFIQRIDSPPPQLT